MTELIDVHTHLNMLELPVAETLAQSAQAGVTRMITIGTGPDDWPLVLGFAKSYFPQVACTLGVHPHDGAVWNADVEVILRNGLKNPEVIAVGEIGLDYFYKNASPEQQLVAFRRQMEIAAEFKMPVEIHTRDAEDDTIMVLNEFAGRVTGLLHCFTSSWKLAEAALKLGYHISFSGVVTFKNAGDLREVCKKVPLDRFHVETDAPFLAPVPHRGQKNRPELVVHTAQLVAELKGLTVEELAQQTRANAAALFQRWPLT